MDFVNIQYDSRYWSKILRNIFQTHLPDLKVNVTEFLFKFLH